MAERSQRPARRDAARAAAILLHGRGSNADDMLALAQEFGQRDIVYLRAAGAAAARGIRIRFSRRSSRTSRI